LGERLAERFGKGPANVRWSPLFEIMVSVLVAEWRSRTAKGVTEPRQVMSKLRCTHPFDCAVLDLALEHHPSRPDRPFKISPDKLPYDGFGKLQALE